MQFHKLFSQSGNEFVLTDLLVVLFIVIPQIEIVGRTSCEYKVSILLSSQYGTQIFCHELRYS